jgi:hypothetical protein
VHGTDIGIASSRDRGATWTYRGVVAGLAHEPGHNTFWAPEIVWVEDRCHMFVSYIQGIPTAWEGHPRQIHHYTSNDLVHWQHHGPLLLAGDRAIDACIFPLPQGGYRLWYKNEADASSTWSLESDDLYDWHSPRHVLSTPGGHEGPNVFRLGNVFWLIVDSWSGQLVYRSADLQGWTPAGRILGNDSRRSGTDDLVPGLHADVHVEGDTGYVLYFVHHPGPDQSGRQSSIQLATVTTDGERLICDSSDDSRLALPEPSRAARLMTSSRATAAAGRQAWERG